MHASGGDVETYLIFRYVPLLSAVTNEKRHPKENKQKEQTPLVIEITANALPTPRCRRPCA